MRKQYLGLLGLIMLLLFGASCDGGTSAELQSQPVPVADEAATAGLPALPVDRSTLSMQQYLLLGSDSYSSAGATEINTATELHADAELAFAAYGFGPLTGIPDNMLVLLDVEQGSEVYLALGDFDSGRWQLSGPFGASTGLNLDPAKHLSSFGGVYVAVIAEPGNNATINALSLNAFDPLNAPPLAELGLEPASGTAPFATTFTAVNSIDDKGIELYLWDFNGDGNYEETGTVPSAQHVYQEAGQFLAGLLVLDSEGSQDSDFVLVSVNAAPGAELSAQPSAEVWPGDTLQLDGTGSFDSEGPLAGYEWELDGDGDFNDQGGNKASIPYIVLSEPGYRDVSLRVTDEFGAQDTATMRLTVKGIGGGALNPPSGAQQHTVSMALAGGIPLLAYEGTDGKLRFVRGLDSSGASWSEAQVIADEPAVYRCCLRVINGKPAVAFMAKLSDQQLQDYTLKYAIAADPLGEAWTSPIDLEVNGWLSESSLRTVRGWPAIAYWDDSLDSVMFMRPQNADGTSWADAFTVAEDAEPGIALEVVGGRPAIVYQRDDNGDGQLCYTLSDDEFGVSWPAGVLLDETDFPLAPSISLVDGAPAVAFIREDSQALMFTRALDPLGAAWAEPEDLAGTGGNQVEAVLRSIAGKPVILFSSASASASMLESLDSLGLGWKSPRVIAETTAQLPSLNLAELEGQAAIAVSGSTGSPEFYREF